MHVYTYVHIYICMFAFFFIYIYTFVCILCKITQFEETTFIYSCLLIDFMKYFCPAFLQGFLLEPEREKVRSFPLKSPGVSMQKATLVWDSSNGKSKKNNIDLKIQIKKSILRNVCTKFGQNMKKMFFCCFSDLKDEGTILPSDFEDITTTYESDDDGDKDGDEMTEIEEFPLILGDTEESHMMAVYR